MAYSPEVSIVVPVYNTGAPLRRCLDSLLAQSGCDYEIVMVNDGSTDTLTLDILDEYTRRAAVIRRLDGPNGGVSAARNRGIDAAKGEWIYFCDSDDTVEPDVCAYLMTLAGRYQSDLAGCALRCGEASNGEVRTNVPVTGEVGWPREAIRKKWMLPLFRLDSSSGTGRASGYLFLALFRRRILLEHHIVFTVGMTMAEDELFFLEYLQYLDSAALSDRVCYHYIFRRDSACGSFFHRRTVEFLAREKNWLFRWEGRLRLCRDFDWESEFPGVALRFWENAVYHATQVVCADSQLSFLEKLRRLREVVRRYRQAPEYRNANWRRCGSLLSKWLFRVCLGLGSWPVLFFCALARLRRSR